ncbi:17.3 kDa class I heat shock protein [Manihot esculenta]|uniref:SHSP domain-containing protein n=1 Tax=Manihot esculenta TaxID=3983 RepID=A0A2C9V2N7_MANES|nr:17.3 kDa class I heat shock protein [Manihot esculenta]OAY38503.1 hypothetical protein MANES_10G020000v8 [Manihot esculenta]
MSITAFFGNRRPNAFDPFSLDNWDPFDGFPFPSITSNDRPSTRIDWKETPTAHVFKADVPGLRKEELKVEVEDGKVLQISGERSKEEKSAGDTWHRIERSSGKFSRRFRLPDDAIVQDVKASMESGVLTVTLPKEAEKKNADVRSIQISD